MADLTVQSATSAGLEVTFASATSGGDAFVNDGKSILRVKNGDDADMTVTIDSPTECNQGGTHDITVTVTAGEERDIGPFLRNRFNDEDGKVQVTYSAVTSVTVAVISI